MMMSVKKKRTVENSRSNEEERGEREREHDDHSRVSAVIPNTISIYHSNIYLTHVSAKRVPHFSSFVSVP